MDKNVTCNNTRCIAKNKCKRYKAFIAGTKTNPIKFSGNKKNACTSYIKYEKSEN